MKDSQSRGNVARTVAESRLAGRLPSRTSTIAVLGVLLLLVSATAPAAAAGQASAVTADEPAFVVDLEEDGSAEVTLRLTYDLTTDDESDAFQTLKSDEQAQQDLRERFLNRMQSVASAAENKTGREMRVHDASITLRTTANNETGIVELSVTWEGLAATTDGKLVVTEPFASDFQPNRTFVVSGPEGYTLASASPTPTSVSDGTAVWEQGADLSGFEATFAPAETTTTTTAATTTTTEAKGPGFGVGIGVLALLGAALLARRSA